MDHTVLPANTPCLPFLCRRLPDGTPLTEVGDIQLQLTTHLWTPPKTVLIIFPLILQIIAQ